jgi:hypothetical protein
VEKILGMLERVRFSDNNKHISSPALGRRRTRSNVSDGTTPAPIIQVTATERVGLDTILEAGMGPFSATSATTPCYSAS